MNSIDKSRKAELVRKLVEQGHGEIIRHLLLGVSKYSVLQTREDIELEYPDTFENRYGKGVHLMTWVHLHLEFTSKYGTSATCVKDGKRVLFAYTTVYEEWLAVGAPGILLEELEACAQDLFV